MSFLTLRGWAKTPKLGGIDLGGANLTGAYLIEADLGEPDLREGDLTAEMLVTNFSGGQSQ
jgi:uncharacterized protein YjbI with pentapeptide repeats